MAVFKCKMCGGSLEITDEQTIVTCDYCSTQQTLPKIDNDKKLALFNRANNLRFKNEFDKAAGIYESIIAEFPYEAEAYWGLVLCKYGIEYVEDVNGCRIPTCHRTLPVAIMEDDDFQQACENADITAKNIYRDEAKAIDKIQKKILNIALNEEPYDIFICYKETDDITGLRTEDSLIAQDIYTQLLKDEYRVFFSRVTLREVAGTEYEPYIYAALLSAKIMLAIGTKHDYYDAVWVKNEWSRFISMMGDDSTKVLIPCFKNMDAYDMPKEFKNMQGLDMGDVTFFGSLIDNIKKVVSKEVGKSVKETVIVNSNNSQPEPLLKRAYMFLEDGDWNSANDYCEKVLDIDPENARAYLGKLMVQCKAHKIEELKKCEKDFSNNVNYKKLKLFGDEELKSFLDSCLYAINERNELAKEKLKKRNKKLKKKLALVFSVFSCFIIFIIILNSVIIPFAKYNSAVEMLDNGKYYEAITTFKELDDYKDSINKIDECYAGIYGEATWERNKNISVGEIYTLGFYEQDNNTANGKEAIEWLVLDKQDNRILVVSKYLLDYLPYNHQTYSEERVDVTWKDCSLRSWLNDEFINNAFSADEIEMIPTVTVTDHENTNFNFINPRDDTEDRIFLLSTKEVEKYFKSDDERICHPTTYASKKDIFGTSVFWWLRSPGTHREDYASFVSDEGNVNNFGTSCRFDCYVRPAMWIEIQ